MKQKPIIGSIIIVVVTGIGIEDESSRFSYIMRKRGMMLMHQ